MLDLNIKIYQKYTQIFQFDFYFYAALSMAIAIFSRPRIYTWRVES